MCFQEISEEDWTLLDSAREGDIPPFELLFSKPDGLNEFTKIKDEYTDANPLHMAAANGKVELLKFILSKLPDTDGLRKKLVNTPNNSGNTPLHWATLTGSLECVKLLCENGADPLQKNNAGVDSCYQADCSNHEEIAVYLFGLVDPESVDAKSPDPMAEEEPTNTESAN